MRLGGRLQAAIDIVQEMDSGHRSASETLRDWGRSHRFAGSGDRAAIGNLVFDGLRKKRSASALLGEDTARAAIIGALILSKSESPVSLAAAFVGDCFAPESLTNRELQAIATFEPSSLTPAAAADVPDWTAALLQSVFGADWVEEAGAMAERPPLDLRVNTIKADRQTVAKALNRSQCVPCALAPHGLRIAPISGHGRHPNVQAEPAFGNGWFEVQDEGSQIVSHLAAGDAPAQVLDYCAGAGGKTLALSAALENRGQIFAYDANKQRLAPMFERLERAGCRNVQVLKDPAGLQSLEGRMDLVIVDAPCSGSGTWRRRPDDKWRLTPQQLEQRIAEQQSILAEACTYVRPGGRLVYVTCSIFPSENDDQIASFVDGNANFACRDPAEMWTGSFPGQTGSVHVTDNGCLLTPRRTDTDGFFISVLVKIDAAGRP